MITSECEFCRYGTVIENSKADVRVYCSIKEKEYWYGVYIPCNNMSKKEKREDDS